MSEDATQQLLVARVEQIVSMLVVTNEELHQVKVRLDSLEKQQGEMNARLERLETIVDQRLYDTRPLWESVLSQIAELDKKIDNRVDELRAENASGFRAVDRKIGALSKNLIDMTAEIQELREMVEKLEAQPA